MTGTQRLLLGLGLGLELELGLGVRGRGRNGCALSSADARDGLPEPVFHEPRQHHVAVLWPAPLLGARELRQAHQAAVAVRAPPVAEAATAGLLEEGAGHVALSAWVAPLHQRALALDEGADAGEGGLEAPLEEQRREHELADPQRRRRRRSGGGRSLCDPHTKRRHSA